MNKRILLVFAHPAPYRSRYNSRLSRVARTLDHVEMHDLYELYPDFHVDVMAEQAALRAADALVLQFPIYWFSAPAILREWQDEVLTKGFAFGPGGDALAGKRFMLAVSSGGEEESYTGAGAHGAPIEEYLKPFEQTARFCGMTVAPAFVTQGIGGLSPADIGAAAESYAARLNDLAGVVG